MFDASLEAGDLVAVGGDRGAQRALLRRRRGDATFQLALRLSGERRSRCCDGEEQREQCHGVA
jgi:hypothetical protein